MDVNKTIQRLRKEMEKEGLFAYVIPSADYHQSEYVAEFFKSRHYISGFTGSAGTVVVTMKEAGLWTDGRYFIQAANQLEGSEIKLFKMGEIGVPTIIEYLQQEVSAGQTVGIDGKVISAQEGTDWCEKLQQGAIQLALTKDLVGDIWENRPAIPHEQAFHLELKYSGKSMTQKLEELRAQMGKIGATIHILTTLDDIAWLFNMRGHDVKYCPVTLCYAVIKQDAAYLFIDKEKLSESLCADFEENHVTLMPYDSIYTYVQGIENHEKVLLDPSKVNYAIDCMLKSEVERIVAINPTILSKAKKNPVEIQNIRNGHIKDGVAFTKFMYWLKTNFDKITITEISAMKQIEKLRSEQEGYIEPSFATIAAYKEHGAMMHYSPTAETDYVLEEGHLFLIDSGGQYYEGTTDLTRTLALGEVSPLLKQHFTAVLRGMMNLSRAQFLKGVRGLNLDILARGPIWNLGLDYKCGTGHGVGYLLNVHEPPNGFRWRIVPERNDSCELEEGMLTTNEPGIYIEGSHGIRIENELIVEKRGENEYGTFLGFETVTVAPIDLDAINVDDMNAEERAYLNAYHARVYETLSPYLNEEEKEWLKIYTRAI
ncbi:MAG: aminopeptidase P family protein [Cellulosilyticaceae bacterium]